MKIEFNKFCVYTHIVDGEIVYVGKGRSYRPFETTRRNSDWLEFMERAESFDVEIVGWYEADKDARLEESKLIRKFNPRLNHHQTSGYTTSSTQKERASIANKGKVLGGETKAKISRSMKGRPPSNKGKPASQGQKIKQRNAHAKYSKPVTCLSSGIRFDSTKHAAKELDIPASTLRAHLNGKLSHAKGMMFSYD